MFAGLENWSGRLRWLILYASNVHRVLMRIRWGEYILHIHGLIKNRGTRRQNAEQASCYTRHDVYKTHNRPENGPADYY